MLSHVRRFAAADLEKPVADFALEIEAAQSPSVPLNGTPYKERMLFSL